MIVKLKCNDELIHDTETQDIRCLTLKLKQKINTADTLTFSIAPNHPMYDSIEELTSTLRLYEIDNSNTLIFKGRVIDKIDTMDGIRTFTCESVLGYLNDSIQPPKVYQDTSIRNYLKDKIDYHNSVVEDKKKFVLGNVTVTNSTDNAYRIDNNYPNTMSNIQEKLIERLGGYLDYREVANKNYIDYVTSYNNVNTQVIEFKKNILDLEKYITSVDLVTALIPLGSKNENTELPITIESVNDGKNYIYDQDAVNRYGWIFGTKTYDDITIPTNLKNRALQDLPDLTKMALSLTITAIDLNLVDVNIEKIKKGDMIKCVSQPHKLNDYFMCAVLEKNYLDPSKSKLTLDKTIKTSSDIAITNDRNLSKINTDIDLNKSYIQSMIKHQTDLITGADGGNVYWKYDSSGKPIEVYFMDTDNIETAREVLRINKNGIGFSSNGVNGTYNTAWTLDGAFNASYITAGVLQGIQIICESGKIGGFEVTNDGMRYSRMNIPIGASRGNLVFNMPTTGHITSGLIFEWSLTPSTSGGGDEIEGRLWADLLEIYGIKCNDIDYTSRYDKKENLKVLDSGLNDVLNTDVYSYNFKNNDKVKYGFVVGSDKYKVSDKIVSYHDGEASGIDAYSALALAYKAIQELNQKIKELEDKIC